MNLEERVEGLELGEQIAELEIGVVEDRVKTLEVKHNAVIEATGAALLKVDALFAEDAGRINACFDNTDALWSEVTDLRADYRRVDDNGYALGREVRRMKRVVAVLFIMWALLVVGLTTAAVRERINAKRVTVSVRAPEPPSPPVEPPAPGPVQPGDRDGPCANKQDCGKS